MSLDFRQLQALAAVIDEGSFDKAARRLALTQSAVTQRIQQLEKRLGKIMVVRETPPRLTRDGETLMKYYRQIEHLQNELLEQYEQRLGGPRVLSIGVNADSLATWLLDALEPLLQREAQLRLDVRVDDQDRTHELLQNGEVIGCVSASNSPIGGCNCFPLGTMVYRCLVTPAYKARHFPHGVNAEAMLLAPCVEYSNNDDLQKNYLKQHFGLTQKSTPHRIPSTESYLDFVARGHAWGMIPDVQSEQLRRQGALVELKPGCTLDIGLYWHIWDLKSNFSRQLTDLLITHAGKVLAS